MKKSLLVIMLFTCFTLLHAQDTARYYDHWPRPPKPGDVVYKVVEQMPEFPGGEASLMKFIQSHLIYPDDAIKIGVQGRVAIGFIIEQDGHIDSIVIKKGVWPSMDAEALRVARLLPPFKPGKQQGKAVRVQFILPIMMKLGNDMLPLVNPNTSDNAERNAVVALRRENYEKALKLLKEVCERDPANNFAAYNLGLCFYQTDDKESAHAQWKKLKEKGFHPVDFLISKYFDTRR